MRHFRIHEIKKRDETFHWLPFCRGKSMLDNMPSIYTRNFLLVLYKCKVERHAHLHARKKPDKLIICCFNFKHCHSHAQKCQITHSLTFKVGSLTCKRTMSNTTSPSNHLQAWSLTHMHKLSNNPLNHWQAWSLSHACTKMSNKPIESFSSMITHMHKNVKATSSFIFKGAPGLLTCSVSPRSYNNPRQSHIHDPKVCRADKEWQHVQPCSPNYPIYPPTPLILQWQNLYLFLAKLFQVIYYLNNILF
jgi:hypothetical protein